MYPHSTRRQSQLSLCNLTALYPKTLVYPKPLNPSSNLLKPSTSYHTYNCKFHCRLFWMLYRVPKYT